jgi:hypothetical protein
MRGIHLEIDFADHPVERFAIVIVDQQGGVNA